MSLGSASSAPGGTVSLPITLISSGGALPAAVQWSFIYSSDITGLTVVTGSSASAAGKSVSCNGNLCLVFGLNATSIGDGTVATATFQIAANPSTSTIPIQLTGLVSSTAGGSSIPATGASGSVSLMAPGPLLTGLTCGSGSLANNANTICSVAVTNVGATPVTVALSQNGNYLNLPSQIALASGQATESFTVSNVSPGVTGVTTVLTANLNGQSKAAQIELGGALQNFIGSMPHLAAEGGWNTTFTLVNKSSAPVETRPGLFDDNGNQLELPLTLPQQGSGPLLAVSMDQTLAPNASFIMQASGSADVPFVEGSAQIFGTGAVDGFAIFHFDPSAQEAVVPLETRNAGSYLLAFDDTNSVQMGVAIENLSVQAVNVPVVLRDDTGAQIGTASIPLNGNGHTSFVLSTQFPQTTNMRGTIEIDTPGFGSPTPGQISVLGIRYTPPGTLTTIPALANVGTGGGSMTHIASGGGWETTFVLVNTGASAAQAQLNFFDDNGNPLSLPLTDGIPSTVASSVAQSLAPGASLWVQSAGTGSLQQGSAQLTTTGHVGGFVIFRYNPDGQEAVVPLESRNASTYLLAFDNTSGTTTGLAISAISTQAITVPVILRDDTGTQIGAGSIPLAANGHYSQMLSTMFPTAIGIRGTAEFRIPAGAQVSVLGIRSPPTLTFTTLPALAK